MTTEPASLDIVIPAYNEAECIQAMLESLQSAVGRLHDVYPKVSVAIMVVDGGSTDQTAQIVQDQGITCAHAPEHGRGNQISHGVKQLSGEWIIILHADSKVNPDALVELMKVLTQRPEAGWGVLGHNYDQGGLLFWLTRLINRWRFDVKGLGYGDQGQFIKRGILETQGGFPEIALMEDVELSLMFKGLPRVRVGEYLTASSRQWKKKGFWKYSFQNLKFANRYIEGRKNGRPASELSQELYSLYYRH